MKRPFSGIDDAAIKYKQGKHDLAKLKSDLIESCKKEISDEVVQKLNKETSLQDTVCTDIKVDYVQRYSPVVNDTLFWHIEKITLFVKVEEIEYSVVFFPQNMKTVSMTNVTHNGQAQKISLERAKPWVGRVQKLVKLLQHFQERRFDVDLSYDYVVRLFDRAMKIIDDDERLPLTEKVSSWKHMFNK